MKTSFLHLLTQFLEQAAADSGIDRAYGKLTVSDRPDLGDYQCNGALAAAKQYKKNPREIAQTVMENLLQVDVFQQVELAGPGFINIRVKDAILAQQVNDMAQDELLGAVPIQERKHILLDYGGPNVAKPMHVGHLRSAIIGESLKRLARLLGLKVTADVHLGDWGLQMGLIIAELKRRQPDLPYFQQGIDSFPIESPVTIDELEEIYPAASKRSKEDAQANAMAHEVTTQLQQGNPGYRALWRHFVNVSVAALKKDYARLGVDFDLWLGESDAHATSEAMIQRFKQKGYAQHDQGALIVHLAEEGDEQPLAPLILLNRDGAVLYGTTDLATIEHRVQELKADAIWYVVDLRQRDHFIQVFRCANKTGLVKDTELEHIGFGTINGKDGKPFKTREGGVMKLKDLISMVTTQAEKRLQEANIAKDYPQSEKLEIAELVGIAALKFSDLVNYRTKNYIFDLEKFVSFEGKTGPYLLYSTVRGRSILNKAKENGLQAKTIINPASDVERDLMIKLVQFPEVLYLSLENRAPNYLCEYAYTLCTAFNRFYRDHHILNEKDVDRQGSWLSLTAFTANLLEKILYLLGIQIPKRM